MPEPYNSSANPSSSEVSFSFDSRGRPSCQKEHKPRAQLPVSFTAVLSQADGISDAVTESFIKELTKFRKPLPKELMKKRKLNW